MRVGGAIQSLVGNWPSNLDNNLPAAERRKKINQKF
jgi:hypothetical protein